MSELTTNLASRWKRLGGTLIDALIIQAIIVPILLVKGFHQQVIAGHPMTIDQQAVIAVGGFVLFLVLNGDLLFKKGQTIGKLAVKTRIVDLNGDIPSFSKLIVLRYLLLGIVFQIPFIGILMAFLNPIFIFGKERRCIHDYMAGTRVINTE